MNLGSHSIEVNGTLTAQGTSNSPIKFNSGAISFTSYCNGYNKQMGLGCSIENGILNATTILCDNTTKINQCIITASVKGEFGIYSLTGNADATNNWWGTNDTQAINQTICDSKNDIILVIIIALGILAFLLVRRKRQHERF